MARIPVAVVLVMAFLPMAGAAESDNKVVNGSFDVDLFGWAPIGDAVFEWDAKDADSNPSSGSGKVTISAAYQTTKCARQCSSVLEGDTEYQIRAMVNNPIGQTGLGWAEIRLAPYSQPNCGGMHLGGWLTSAVYSTDPDQWLVSWGTLTTPSIAQSAVVDLCVSKNTATGTLAVAFDNVRFLGPEIFEGGFEDGTFGDWIVFP